MDGHLKIPKGWGSKKPKFLSKSMKLNWNFWRARGGGGGFNPEIHPWGRCGYFLEQNIIHMLLKCTVNQFAVCEVLKCHIIFI